MGTTKACDSKLTAKIHYLLTSGSACCNDA